MWKPYPVALLLLVLCSFATARPGRNNFMNLDDLPLHSALHKKVLNTYPHLHEDQAEDFLKYLKGHEEFLKTLNLSKMAERQTPVTFSCPTYSYGNTSPLSVHALRPSDIKVVAALGDSLTAGFGAKAKNIFQVFTEYRGVSWSIGGDYDITKEITMPNILRKYNPSLIGYSLNTGSENSVNSKFNGAVTGTRSEDLPDQAMDLIEKIRDSSEVNLEEDWKVVTIWIGGNDLCDYCNDPEHYSPENYQENVRETLKLLKEELPRTFVNLVLGIDVTMLHEVDDGFCVFLHIYECACATHPDKNVRAQIAKALVEYNNLLISLRDEEEFNDSDDFTVVIQPFLRDTQLPRDSSGKPDLTYFAPDCFHFSHLSHEAAAVALWNNMIEPVPTKLTQWTIGESIECPAEDDFLTTNKNSQ